ncbi:MAG: hypothetical protein J0H23_09800 [Micrococcales bacterium]|nr:hypothetical protein [Micrococcales bacterium]OJX69704.1 MAG: hypothetical protein BGO94_14620 [Micrococcales bacterium 72-143]
MNEKKMKRPVKTILGWALVVTVAAGSAAVGVIVGRTMAPADAAPGAAVPVNEGAPLAFEINRFGQTFGDYGVGLRDDPGANPELIRVIGIDGVEGYAYTTEVFGVPAATLEEAARMTEDTLEEKQVPVYEQDGRTVIGTYIANAGYGDRSSTG